MNTFYRGLIIFFVMAAGCAHRVENSSASSTPAPLAVENENEPSTPTELATPNLPPAPSVSVVDPIVAAKPKADYSSTDLEFLPEPAKLRLRFKVGQAPVFSTAGMTMIYDGKNSEIPTDRPKSPYCVVYNIEFPSSVRDGDVLKLQGSTKQALYRDVGTLQIYLTEGVYLQCLNTQGTVTLDQLNAILGGTAKLSLD